MKRGITLLEVLVSMLLLSLVVTGMFATFAIVSKGRGGLGGLEPQALNYARETLEKLKNAVSEDTAVRGASLVDSNPAPNIGRTYNDPPVDTRFSRRYVVDDVDIDGLAYKRVTVTVRWNN